MASIHKRYYGKDRTRFSYEVRYTSPDGKQRSESRRTHREALELRRDVENRLSSGAWTDPARGRRPFDEWANSWRDGLVDLRASSLARDSSYLKNHVIPGFASHSVESISRNDVQAWVRELHEEKGLAPRTVRECYRILSAVMTAAVEEHLRTESPCRRIRLPAVEAREPRFLSPAEVEALASHIDPKFEALIYAAAYLGCRWQELVGLKRTNLDLLRRRVRIVGTLEEVGGKVRYTSETKTPSARRTLPLAPFMVDILARHLENAPESEYVFPGSRGKPLYRSGFRGRFWLPAVEAAGLSPLRFHDLRHSCASILVDQGVNPLELQRWMGHASINVTLGIYTHLFKAADERLMNAQARAFEDGSSSSHSLRTTAKVVALEAAKVAN